MMCPFLRVLVAAQLLAWQRQRLSLLSVVERGLPGGARALLPRGYVALGVMAPRRPRPAALFVALPQRLAFEHTSPANILALLDAASLAGPGY